MRLRKTMLTESQEKWLTALESGQYEQGLRYLCRNNKYCCLGVACDIFNISFEVEECIDNIIKTYNKQQNSAPPDIVNALNLHDCLGSKNGVDDIDGLARLNDRTYTFKEIAAIIRENPSDYFRGEVPEDC